MQRKQLTMLKLIVMVVFVVSCCNGAPKELHVHLDANGNVLSTDPNYQGPGGGFGGRAAAPVGPPPDGCGPEDYQPRTFNMAQLARWNSCPPLSKEDCLFLHEAIVQCPCVCRKRISGHNPRGNRYHRPQLFPEPVAPPQPPPLPPAEGAYEEGDYQGGEAPYVGEEYGTGGQPPDYYDSDAPLRPPADDSDRKKPRREGGFLCFHSLDTVDTIEGPLSMKSLANQMAAGQPISVRAWNQEKNEFIWSPIKYWLHAEPETSGEFQEIFTKSGRKLSITGNHLIYRSTNCDDVKETVFASKVKVNDCVFTESGQDQVSSVSVVAKTGMYSPVTEQGSIIVNGIATSCYGSIENENLASMVLFYVQAMRNVFANFLPLHICDSFFGSFDFQAKDRLSYVTTAFLELQKLFV